MAVDLNEGLEHALEIDRAYADAGVSHADAHGSRVYIARDVNPAAVWGELGRIGDEIEQDLLEPFGVRGHDDILNTLSDGERDAFRLRLKRAESVDF